MYPNFKQPDIDIFPPDMDYRYFENHDLYPFKYKKADFDIINAWFLAEVSFLAYCHPQFVELTYYKLGLKIFKEFIGNSVTFAFVASNSRYAIVSFRGTELKSLNFFTGAIADLSFGFTKVKNGQVHMGFKNALDEIWSGENGLENYLNSLRRKHPAIKIWFTGHSLGAAMATISISRFEATTGLYTYGSPRVGNTEFVKSIKCPVYRIVNNADPITHLPPKKINIFSPEQEYKHVGILKFITKDKNISDVPIKTAYDINIGFKDHAPIFYATNLKANLSKKA